MDPVPQSSGMSAEIIVIILVLCVQAWVFLKTWGNINKIKRIFPEISTLKLVYAKIKEKRARLVSGDELMSQILSSGDEPEIDFISDDESEQKAGNRALTISLIYPGRFPEKGFMNIIRSTNIYLIRNKNHAADFKIMREIVDGELESLENQVESTLNLPLYLGLLGTIAGIVFGLSGLSSNVESGQSAELLDSIPVLLNGVMIAMFASAVGLGLTIVGSGFLYKKALEVTDRRKNGYFTFIQTELLPILARDMASSLTTLQANMYRFNESFNKNLDRFSKSTVPVQENLKEQRLFLRELQKIGYSELVRGNIKTFKELQKSAHLFEDFVATQRSLNNTIKQAKTITSSLEKLFERFSSFDGKAEAIEQYMRDSFQENKAVMDYVKGYIADYKTKEKVLDSHITSVDDYLMKGMEKLQESAENSLKEFRSFTANEENYLQKAYEQNKPKFGKLEKLDNLEKLDGLKMLEDIDVKLELLNESLDKPIPESPYNEKILMALQEMNANLRNMAGKAPNSLPRKKTSSWQKLWRRIWPFASSEGNKQAPKNNKAKSSSKGKKKVKSSPKKVLSDSEKELISKNRRNPKMKPIPQEGPATATSPKLDTSPPKDHSTLLYSKVPVKGVFVNENLSKEFSPEELPIQINVKEDSSAAFTLVKNPEGRKQLLAFSPGILNLFLTLENGTELEEASDIEIIEDGILVRSERGWEVKKKAIARIID